MALRRERREIVRNRVVRCRLDLVICPHTLTQRTGSDMSAHSIELQSPEQSPGSTHDFAIRSRDYARIAEVLQYLAQHWQEQPTLGDLAAHAGLSEGHLQRMFCHWVGISPKRFLQHLTLERAKQVLSESRSVLETTFDVGLSSPSRLHDLFVSCEAVTPGEFKTCGKDMTVRFGFHPTPFGECLLLLSERGLCGLSFVVGDDRESAFKEATAGWRRARLVADQDATGGLIPRIFVPADGHRPAHRPLRLYLRGTRFQVQVWQALLKVPAATLISYQQLAEQVGCPRGGARAVGQAVGANPIAVLVPCHRVIRQSAMLGGYRSGLSRKLALLGWEAVAAEGHDRG